jgi:hypothetical protein
MTQNSVIFWNDNFKVWQGKSTTLLIHCDISKQIRDAENYLGLAVVGLKIDPTNSTNIELVLAKCDKNDT